MINVTQIRRKVVLAAALLLMIVLVGCLGRNGLFAPWSQTQDSRLEHVSAATFEERVLKCEKPVLVDFYAEWCGPCKQLGPILEDFAQEHPDVRVVKVNVDENSDLVGCYKVKAMPTLLVIRGGKVTSRSTGLVTKANLQEMTKENSTESPVL
jgi:thioredoxin 1